MNEPQTTALPLAEGAGAAPFDMMEVVVLPVSDVDRAKRFYATLGWRLDLDYAADAEFRVIQFTPPGSACSIIFGRNITPAGPGTAQGPHLVVPDIVAAREALIRRGIAVGELFHDGGGVFHRAGLAGRINGPNPPRRSYASYAAFNDPDGNGWFLQEVTARLPGDPATRDASFTPEIVNVLRRADAK
jgi:catechol 2,3-dioxygenase-like lactoylglutathione lyase family enzyme